MTTMITAPSQEAQAQYDSLSSRKGELRAELGAVNGEISTILDSLGALVASGANFAKQIARLAVLRQQVEALEAGDKYISGQTELLERSNYGLSKR